MRPPLAVRGLALAGASLLAAVAALAVTAQLHHHRSASPEQVGSFTALAGSAGSSAIGKRTSCGGVIGPDTEGIAHPTLPCGARIYISYRGRTVIAQVIDRGPYHGGRQMDLTVPLANRLGLVGVQTVQWSYARTGR
ncbi:MAG TPA: septal ring lytic transglycosylase RlpA family protein [Gaiellaceae bacterium]|nr:septal ring lytic transglycosylase RlpA family protein [Gaiellaceae bacterium]